jgi:hypothetical protein
MAMTDMDQIKQCQHDEWPEMCEQCLRDELGDSLRKLDVANAELARLNAQALELCAEISALRRDAARYRWLRDRAWPFEFNGNTPEDADAAIDKSMHLAARLAAAKKHTPECSYWDGLMAQVCNCGLAERDHNDD